MPSAEEMSQSRAVKPISRTLFAIVIFLGAFLLFSVQLLLGKYILPWFGGTAGVWASCLFFFQTTLLAGYAYAHGTVTRLRPNVQTRLHAALLLASLALMGFTAYVWPSPITPGSSWKPHSGETAIWLILRLLLVSVGAGVTLLATTGPLVQHWFTRAYPGESPYRLYALSNAGSLLGLLSYPAFIERWFRLNTQAWLWCAAYLLYAAAAIALAATGFRRTGNSSTVAASHERESPPEPGMKDKLTWFSLAALGSLMLLAISRFITADLAPIPLLWVLPLAVYLLSFIVCFDHPRWYLPGLFHPFLMAAAVFTIMFYHGIGLHLWMFIAAFLLTQFACCMFCHGELYRRRPDPAHLTSFYLMIALGGVAGSAFVTLAAPFLFRGYWEMHAGIAIALIAMAAIATVDNSSWLNRQNPFIAVSLISWAALTAAFWLSSKSDSLRRFLSDWHWAVLLGFAVVCTLLAAGSKSAVKVLAQQAPQLNRWTLFTAVSAASVLLIWAGTAQYRRSIWAHRNFYGSLYIAERQAPDPHFNAYAFTHSNTLHGIQFVSSDLRPYPTAYYNQTSGIGILLMNYPRHQEDRTMPHNLRVGVIGLGAGTIATYGQAGDVFRFYEIDPEVVLVASGDHGYFSFLSGSQARIEIVSGDGRLSLERELAQRQPQSYDIFIVDAFNGDAVPVHLLTREAFELYLDHLRDENSVIAVHVTNRAVELASVVAAEAQHFHLSLAYVNAPGITSDKLPDGIISPNQWILLSRSKTVLSLPAIEKAGSPLHLRHGLHFWTDDQSNLLQILR